MSTQVAVQNEEWSKFVAAQEAQSARNSRPSPDGIRLNGNTGKFSRSFYNKDTKKTEFADFAPGQFPENHFNGVVLAVRYLARWKYKENSPWDIRTREFSFFRDEPIELLKIETANRSAEPSTKVYSDYLDFKSQVSSADPISGDIKLPYDLFVSLFMLIDGKIYRYRFTGSTRSAWFDFTQNNETALPLMLLKFGVSEPQKFPAKEGEEPKVYYYGTFTQIGPVEGNLQDEVMKAMRDLETWFNSFKKKGEALTAPVSVQVEAPKAAPIDEEIDVSSIPF